MNITKCSQNTTTEIVKTPIRDEMMIRENRARMWLISDCAWFVMTLFNIYIVFRGKTGHCVLVLTEQIDASINHHVGSIFLIDVKSVYLSWVLQECG